MKLSVSGNASSCSLVLPRPELQDHGSWTCAISDDKSLETMKVYKHLNIMVEGQISLSPSTTFLELGEGDMADLVCMVKEGYPKADISWVIDREIQGVLHTGSQVYQQSNTFFIYHLRFSISFFFIFPFFQLISKMF